MMASVPLVQAPGGFVPAAAVCFGALDSAPVPVDAAHPLPVAGTIAAASSAPLAGSTGASGAFGPFVPQLGRAIWLTLSGSWSGTMQVQRSLDGGATRVPLTVAGQAWAMFSANCCEPVAEETVAGATYYLSVTLASGTLAYRVQQ
jgi:hypothetical protein